MARLPPGLMKHFLAPRHVGAVAGSSARAVARNPSCGDHLELGLWRGGDGALEMRFQARACSAVIASASLVAEAVAGRLAEEVEALDLGALVSGAGGLPQGGRHALSLVQRALRQALAELPPRYP